MAWAPDYSTLALLKAHMRVTDVNDDVELQACLTAASRAIDYECDRQFGSAAQTRYYSPDCQLLLDGRPALAIDDTFAAMTVTTDLANNGLFATSLVSGTDYDLWPYNAPSDVLPWTHLLLKSTSNTYLPWTNRSVKVVGTFGWTAVPAVVADAVLIQAARFFVRRDSAYGVAGSPSLGSEVRLLARLDPDVALLLTSVKRRWGAV